MQPILQDMAVFNSRLAQQEAATRATPWAPGLARAAAAMHGAPPHGVDVGASSDLNHSAFPVPPERQRASVRKQLVVGKENLTHGS